MAGDSPTFTFTPTVAPVFTVDMGSSARDEERLDAARREVATPFLAAPENQPPTRAVFDQLRTRLQQTRQLNNQQINQIFNQLAAERPNDHITPQMTGVNDPANQTGPAPDPAHGGTAADAHGGDPRDAAGLGADSHGATAFVRNDNPTLAHLSAGIGTGDSVGTEVPPALAYVQEQLAQLPQDPTLRAQFFSTLRTDLKQLFQVPDAEITQLFEQFAGEHPELNITPEMISGTNVPASPQAYVPVGTGQPVVTTGEGTPVLEGGIKDFGGGTPHPGEDPAAALGNRAATLQYGKILGGGTAAALFARPSPFEGRPTVRLADLRSGRVGGTSGASGGGSARRSGGATGRARSGDTEEDLFALVGRGVYQGLMG